MFSSSCCLSAPQVKLRRGTAYSLCFTDSHSVFNPLELSFSLSHSRKQHSSRKPKDIILPLICPCFTYSLNACDCLSLLFLKMPPGRFPDILSSGSQVFSRWSHQIWQKQIRLLPWALPRAQDSTIQLPTSQLHSYGKLHSSSPHLIKKLYQHLHGGWKQQHRSDF